MGQEMLANIGEAFLALLADDLFPKGATLSVSIGKERLATLSFIS